MKKPSRCSTCSLAACKMVQPSASAASEIMFLSTSPGIGTSNAFRCAGGTIVRGLLRKLAEADTSVAAVQSKIGYGYSVWCRVPEDENLKKSQILSCKELVSGPYLAARAPKVILAFGGQQISTFFGSASSKKGEMRGSNYTHRWPGGKQSLVIFTISLSWLASSPGLAGLVVSDIKSALKAYTGATVPSVSYEDLRHQYDVPLNLKDTKELLEEYSVYKKGGKPIEQSLMSLDTETNTLFPWWDQAKIISISAGFSKDKALSFAVDHKDSAYELADIAPWVLKLTMSNHPKAWWNFKFDHGMFNIAFKRRLKEVMTPGLSKDINKITGCSWKELLETAFIKNTRWDGQLGEHLLDEDKSGFYSLKSVILDYIPHLYGYEDVLKESLIKIEEKALGKIDGLLEEMNLSEIGVDTDIMEVTTSLLDVKATYDSKKKSIFRKIRGFKSRGRDGRAKMEEEKLKHLATCYSRLRSAIIKGKKEYKDSIFSKSPDVASQTPLWTYEDINLQLLLTYGAIDAAATASISNTQRKILNQQSKIHCSGKQPILSLMDRHALPLSTLFSTIQGEGVYVDQKYAKELSETLATEISKMETDIKQELSSDFPGLATDELNFNSDKDLANILIGWYGLPVLEETKSKQASMKGEHLKVYKNKHSNKVAGLLVDYSAVRKAKSDFVDKFLYLSDYDSRVHGNYKLHGTATGRASGNNPNLTNIPAKVKTSTGEHVIKKCLICTPLQEDKNPDVQALAVKYNWTSSDRLIMVDADLSGAEIRILTRFAPDQGLITAIRNGLDVHSWMTSEIHGVDYDEIQALRKGNTPRGKHLDSLRDGTKAVVFKIMYGGTPDDKNLMNMIFNRFPAIPRYMESCKREIYNKEILVTPNGRPRRFPLVKLSRNIERRNYRQGINFNVQSYCSDIVMHTLLQIYRNLKELRGRLLLTVHDSIVFEIPEKELHLLDDFLDKYITEHINSSFPDIEVPMTYGYKLGFNYGEMLSLTDWKVKYG